MKALRSFLAFAVGALLVMPLAAEAAPTPSPSLDTVLVKPPAIDFNELTTSAFNGLFTAHDFATLNGNNSAAIQTENTLNRDGFVQGYGKTWTQASSGHGLIEAVMAFAGGQGAKNALRSLETGDKSDASYTGADTVAGVNPYYGAHFVDPTHGLIEDAFGFVKGNDVFAVLFVSSKDDVADLAATQTKLQYDSAPGSTIPSWQWPENTSGGSAAFQLGAITAGVLIALLIVGVVGVVVGLVLRTRRRAPAVAGYAMTGAPAGYSLPPAVEMSPDGSYWWDGQAWRDAAQEAPPHAQRSTDGVYWWDGRTWREVPRPPS
ncbi:MAG TPA: hypothetical protein VGT01_07720 [Candidatus Dormibacteraeota bacterium]|nr:hypothetical protein [Candidatus Dormibacteraeota bacterium]